MNPSHKLSMSKLLFTKLYFQVLVLSQCNEIGIFSCCVVVVYNVQDMIASGHPVFKMVKNNNKSNLQCVNNLNPVMFGWKQTQFLHSVSE